MSTYEVGKKFEKKVYKFLLERFEAVIWASNKNNKSPYDFKCLDGEEEYFGDAKFVSNENAKPGLSKSQKNLDFIATNKKGKIIIINKSEFKDKVNIESDNKKESKAEKLCKFISGMGLNEEVKVTNLARETEMHVNSMKDMIDAYEIIKNAPKIQVVRDKNHKIKRVVRIVDEENDMYLRREIRNTLTNIHNKIDILDENLSGIKKIVDKVRKEITDIKKEQ